MMLGSGGDWSTYMGFSSVLDKFCDHGLCVVMDTLVRQLFPVPGVGIVAVSQDPRVRHSFWQERFQPHDVPLCPVSLVCP